MANDAATIEDFVIRQDKDGVGVTVRQALLDARALLQSDDASKPLYERVDEAMPLFQLALTRLERVCDEFQAAWESLDIDRRVRLRSQFVEELVKFVGEQQKYRGMSFADRVLYHKMLARTMNTYNYKDGGVDLLFMQIRKDQSLDLTSEWKDQHDEAVKTLETVLKQKMDDTSTMASYAQDPLLALEAATLFKNAERDGSRIRWRDNTLAQELRDKIKHVWDSDDVVLPDWFLPESDITHMKRGFAAGSFGNVHHGTWGTGTKVVVKALRMEDDNKRLNDELRELFIKQANMWSRLSHPYVLKLYGACHVTAPPFFVCEDANGDLRNYLDKDKTRRWRLLFQSALAIEYLHGKSIVHGNVMSDNILVGADGHARMSGFALSSTRKLSPNQTHTREKSAVAGRGALRWCAPETLEKVQQFESDIYSFGLCIWEAFSGKIPYNDFDDTEVERMISEHKIPKKPSEMADDVWMLVQKMLAFDETDRPTIKEVVAELKKLANIEFDEEQARKRLCSICSNELEDGSPDCKYCMRTVMSKPTTREVGPMRSKEELPRVIELVTLSDGRHEHKAPNALRTYVFGQPDHQRYVYEAGAISVMAKVLAEEERTDVKLEALTAMGCTMVANRKIQNSVKFENGLVSLKKELRSNDATTMLKSKVMLVLGYLAHGNKPIQKEIVEEADVLEIIRGFSTGPEDDELTLAANQALIFLDVAAEPATSDENDRLTMNEVASDSKMLATKAYDAEATETHTYNICNNRLDDSASYYEHSMLNVTAAPLEVEAVKDFVTRQNKDGVGVTVRQALLDARALLESDDTSMPPYERVDEATPLFQLALTRLEQVCDEFQATWESLDIDRRVRWRSQFVDELVKFVGEQQKYRDATFADRVLYHKMLAMTMKEIHDGAMTSYNYKDGGVDLLFMQIRKDQSLDLTSEWQDRHDEAVKTLETVLKQKIEDESIVRSYAQDPLLALEAATLFKNAERDGSRIWWRDNTLAQELRDKIKDLWNPTLIGSSDDTHMVNLTQPNESIALEERYRRYVCVIGPRKSGRTSLIKSLVTQSPSLEHRDERTIGIEQVPLRFGRHVDSEARVYDIVFIDRTGEYQVEHSLFYSKQALYLVCVDVEACLTAYMQAYLMSRETKHIDALMDEFVEGNVLRWIRPIVMTQPDAEFAFVCTKNDALAKAGQFADQLKACLLLRLGHVEGITNEMKREALAGGLGGNGRTANTFTIYAYQKRVRQQQARGDGAWTGGDIGLQPRRACLFVSCSSTQSVNTARNRLETMIVASDRSLRIPESYSNILKVVTTMRASATARGARATISEMLTPVGSLVEGLSSATGLSQLVCRGILRTMHDIGDFLWHEENLKTTTSLDVMLLIDLMRQVLNRVNSGEAISHRDLFTLPFWNGMSNEHQWLTVKQMLHMFHFVHPSTGVMRWDSDLLVPASRNSKTPAAWLFLGEDARLISTLRNDDPDSPNEQVRIHWQYHFVYEFPDALFDQFVLASYSPYLRRDVGPDWILYAKEGVFACRAMVSRDRNSLQRLIQLEAVLAVDATASDTDELWDAFETLSSTLERVVHRYSGLVVSRAALDDQEMTHSLDDLIAGDWPPHSKWMPSRNSWEAYKLVIKQIHGVIADVDEPSEAHRHESVINRKRGFQWRKWVPSIFTSPAAGNDRETNCTSDRRPVDGDRFPELSRELTGEATLTDIGASSEKQGEAVAGGELTVNSNKLVMHDNFTKEDKIERSLPCQFCSMKLPEESLFCNRCGRPVAVKSMGNEADPSSDELQVAATGRLKLLEQTIATLSAIEQMCDQEQTIVTSELSDRASIQQTIRVLNKLAGKERQNNQEIAQLCLTCGSTVREVSSACDVCRVGSVATTEDLPARGVLPVETVAGKLLHASQFGDLVKVQAILEGGSVDLNISDEKDGYTPLHWAVSCGHTHIAKLLVQGGANLGVIDKCGRTPLHLACGNHNSEIVRILLTAGADAHVRDTEGRQALHRCILRDESRHINDDVLAMLQVLVEFGVTWDDECEGMIDNNLTWREAAALGECVRLWTAERAKPAPFTHIEWAIIREGPTPTRDYISALRESRQINHRHKVCVTGNSKAGKTSLIKSITTNEPSLVHLDKRTIGIDRFEYEFKVPQDGKTHVHKVEFWDYAGQDEYQVGHAVFFSDDALYVVCVDLEATMTAYMQSDIMSFTAHSRDHVMNEFVERNVLRWVRVIFAHKPKAEFVFVATKHDILSGHEVFATELKEYLSVKLNLVAGIAREMKRELNHPVTDGQRKADHLTLYAYEKFVHTSEVISAQDDVAQAQELNERARPEAQEAASSSRSRFALMARAARQMLFAEASRVTNVGDVGQTRAVSEPEHTVRDDPNCQSLYVSCTDVHSVSRTITDIISLILTKTQSIQFPDDELDLVDAVVKMRLALPQRNADMMVRKGFLPIKDLEDSLIEATATSDELTCERTPTISRTKCRTILRKLHNIGDVLWFESIEIDLFDKNVILDPMILIKFIKQVVNHHQQKAEQLAHCVLHKLPYWVNLNNADHIRDMKLLLQHFLIVYPSAGKMVWESDLVVPAYWRSKAPAAWVFGYEDLRLAAAVPNSNLTKPPEQVRVHWQYHFTYEFPDTLFDFLVVATHRPTVTRDAGPDWILYTIDGVFACRVMVSRDETTLQRILHLEAVLAPDAEERKAHQLWQTFDTLSEGIVVVLRRYPGIHFASAALKVADRSGYPAPVQLQSLFEQKLGVEADAWMPPEASWDFYKRVVLGNDYLLSEPSLQFR